MTKLDRGVVSLDIPRGSAKAQAFELRLSSI
jgi:hypothetical protein